MANPGLLLKGVKALSKTPAGKKIKNKTYELMTNAMKKPKKKYVPSKYKKGGKGPGASTRTTKPAEVTKSYGQAQRSTDNMFRNDSLTRDVNSAMKSIYDLPLNSRTAKKLIK